MHLGPDGEELDSWYSPINPERNVGATQVHGLSNAQLRGAPTFGLVAEQLCSHIQGTVVAHNATFDLRFILNQLRAEHARLRDFRWLCTMRLASDLGIPKGRRKLADLADLYGVDLYGAHNALADAKACGEIMFALQGSTAAALPAFHGWASEVKL